MHTEAQYFSFILTSLQVLHRSAGEEELGLFDVYGSTETVLFLGTPHRGSSKASLGEIAARIATVSGFDAASQNLQALQVNSYPLEHIQESFVQLKKRKDWQMKLFTFQEAKGALGTSILGANQLVSEFSLLQTLANPVFARL